MIDRVPTEILSNGAIRYGIYDADSNLIRYEYIKLEDDPTQEGDALNKANLLPDAVATALGLTGNPQVKDALSALTTLVNGKAKIVTGSYTGTGTYGVDNLNSITLSFAPKLVFIADVVNGYYALFVTAALSSAYGTNGAWWTNASGGGGYAKLVSNTLSWYQTTTAIAQLNYSGASYTVVGIG